MTKETKFIVGLMFCCLISTGAYLLTRDHEVGIALIFAAIPLALFIIYK